MMRLLLGLHLLAPAESDAPATLRWRAEGAGCPSGPEVQAAVVELAGRWPAADELEVDASIDEALGRWQLVLSITIEGREHRQRLEAESCAALARAAALIVAVSVDPVASATTAEVPLAPTVPELPPAGFSDEPPGGSSARRAPQVPPSLRTEAPLRWRRTFLGARWGLISGMTPGLTSGPSVSLGLDLEHARFALQGQYGLPRVRRASGSGARVQAGMVAALACVASRPRALRGQLCAGAEAGALRARGLGVPSPRTQHYPWLAAVAGAGVRGSPSSDRWALTLDVEGTVATVDAHIVLGDPQAPDAPLVYETPRLGARLLLGVEFFRPRGRRR